MLLFSIHETSVFIILSIICFCPIVRVLQGRENSGPLSRKEAIPTKCYSKMQLYRHTLGHLSAVYCVLFDRTGKYIITGADDLLVKVWSSIDGRLLATFRGASAEIMDIAVNFDNTLLAAGSLDRILRVWCFQTMSPVSILNMWSVLFRSRTFALAIFFLLFPLSLNQIFSLFLSPVSAHYSSMQKNTD